jgi:hypothetical protein
MRFLFPVSLALLALAAIAPAQTPATTPALGATPAAKPAAAAVKPRATPFPRPPFARSDALIETGGFEAPPVKKRTPLTERGNPLPYSQGEFIEFRPNDAAKDGTFITGITNESAHTGHQSIYFEYRKQSKPRAEIRLATNLVPIKPKSLYHVSIWGHNDPKTPLTLDQKLPLLMMEIDFYLADHETQTGDPIFRIQPMPGTLNRPPVFPTDSWGEYDVPVTSPDDAAFVKVTWTWTTSSEKGETNGVIYFDDAIITGDKPEVVETPEPTEPTTDAAGNPAMKNAEEAAAKEPAAPGSTPEPTAKPAETAAPAPAATPAPRKGKRAR